MYVSHVNAQVAIIWLMHQTNCEVMASSQKSILANSPMAQKFRTKKCSKHVNLTHARVLVVLENRAKSQLPEQNTRVRLGATQNGMAITHT